MENLLVLLTLCVSLTAAAPGHYLPTHQATGYAAAPEALALPAAGPVSLALPAATAAVYEQIHAGPPVAYTQVHHGVVGTRTVQVGTQPVLAGHEYVATSKTVHQPAPFSYVAGQPKTYQTTQPLPAPAIPAPIAPVIPPAPRNYGPAPADTVTQEKVVVPVRTHTIITPQVRRIEPELQVNRYAVEVPVPNPIAVEREVIVPKHVLKPYRVEVPQPFAVPQPYEVHPVHQVVETPVIEHNTYSIHTPAAVAIPHVAVKATTGYH